MVEKKENVKGADLMSFDDYADGSSASGIGSSMAETLNDKGWVTQERSVRGSGMGSVSGASYTGFDATGDAHRRVQAPSTRASELPDVGSRRTSGFAKIRVSGEGAMQHAMLICKQSARRPAQRVAKVDAESSRKGRVTAADSDGDEDEVPEW